MSAGPFEISSYEADYGTGDNVHGIRVQIETIAATAGGVPNQTLPAPDVTSPISAQVSASTRGLGLHARIVRLKNPTPVPLTYTPTSSTQIPALSKAFYIACQTPGQTCSYLGAIWLVSGSRAEKVR